MRKSIGSIFIAVVSLGVVGAAFAADLPVKAPVIAPPPAIWTGFYIGGSIGARWDDTSWNTTCLQPGLVGVTCPGNFPAQFGNNNPAGFDSAGFKASVYGGYNWQVAPVWVVGLEADIGWGNSKETLAGIPGAESPTNPAAPGLDTSTVKQTWDGSVRLRGGYLINPTTLIFATGGVAFTHIEARAFCGSPFSVGWCAVGNVGRTDTQSTNRVGWTVGGGIEAILWSNWLVRAEYRYADYGTWSTTFMQGPISNIDALDADIKVRTHTAQIGLAYKFGAH